MLVMQVMSGFAKFSQVLSTALVNLGYKVMQVIDLVSHTGCTGYTSHADNLGHAEHIGLYCKAFKQCCKLFNDMNGMQFNSILSLNFELYTVFPVLCNTSLTLA